MQSKLEYLYLWCVMCYVLRVMFDVLCVMFDVSRVMSPLVTGLLLRRASGGSSKQQAASWPGDIWLVDILSSWALSWVTLCGPSSSSSSPCVAAILVAEPHTCSPCLGWITAQLQLPTLLQTSCTATKCYKNIKPCA